MDFLLFVLLALAADRLRLMKLIVIISRSESHHMWNHSSTAVSIPEACKALSEVQVAEPLHHSSSTSLNMHMPFFPDYIARETAWKRILIYPESSELEYTLMWAPL